MKESRALVWALFLSLTLPQAAPAGRVTTLDGTLSFTEEWESNLYLTDKDEKDAWFTGGRIRLTLGSEGRRDSATLSYGLGARHNSETGEVETSHALTLSAQRLVSKRLSLSLQDTFSSSYNPLDEAFRGQRLYRNAERRRSHVSNNAALGASYAYGEGSALTLSYRNSLLHTPGEIGNDYMRHTAGLGISHRLSVRWSVVLDYSYDRGLLENTSDTWSHTGGGGLEFHPTLRDTLGLRYTRHDFHYQGPEADYTTHGGNLYWTRALDEHHTLSLSGGATYWENDEGRNTWAASFTADLSREFRHGRVSLTGSGGYDERQFSSDSAGLSRYWEISLAAQRALSARLSASASARFRRDDFVEQRSRREEWMEGSFGLSYTLGRHTTAALRYSAHILDSTLPGEDFTDHTVLFTLSYGREFLRRY